MLGTRLTLPPLPSTSSTYYYYCHNTLRHQPPTFVISHQKIIQGWRRAGTPGPEADPEGPQLLGDARGVEPQPVIIIGAGGGEQPTTVRAVLEEDMPDTFSSRSSSSRRSRGSGLVEDDGSVQSSLILVLPLQPIDPPHPTSCFLRCLDWQYISTPLTYHFLERQCGSCSGPQSTTRPPPSATPTPSPDRQVRSSLP